MAGRAGRAPVILCVLVLALAAGACAGRGSSSTHPASTLRPGGVAPTTTAGHAPTTGRRARRVPLPGFTGASYRVRSGSRSWLLCLLVAASDQQRSQGLTGVSDPTLGGYDGMAFEFGGPIRATFWMRGTPMPLSIAYYDEKGAFVQSLDMEPCGDRSDCPLYQARGAFVRAVEVPKGLLAARGLVEGSVLLPGGDGCRT